MQVLLDHNITRLLKPHFYPHEVGLTKEEGWQELENGALLTVAQEKYDVLITADRNLYHQQKVAAYDIAIIVLRAYSNRYDALVVLVEEVLREIETIQPGEVCYLYVDTQLLQSDQRQGRGLNARQRTIK